MTDLKKRSLEPEILDQSGYNYDEYARNMRELGQINRLSLAYRPLLNALGHFWKLHRSRTSSPMTVLDAGFGYGDFMRTVTKWARRRHIALEVEGVDRHPWSVPVARSAGADLNYRTGDLFELPDDRRYHVIINSLFAHHLDDPTLSRFLRWMERHSSLGWFLSDIHRHPIPYYFVKHFVRIMGYGRLTSNDAPLSVAKSFTRDEWIRLLKQADLRNTRVHINWRFPFKYCLTGVRTDEG